jgi:hypothetical protein
MVPVSRKDFPKDDDGEVLYRLASKGLDLNCKREIQFYCYANGGGVAEKIADDLTSYGYKSHVFVDEKDEGYTRVSVYSAITMLPSYELIVLEQKRLNLILRPYGTTCDGWMTESTPEKSLE